MEKSNGGDGDINERYVSSRKKNTELPRHDRRWLSSPRHDSFYTIKLISNETGFVGSFPKTIAETSMNSPVPRGSFCEKGDISGPRVKTQAAAKCLQQRGTSATHQTPSY